MSKCIGSVVGCVLGAGWGGGSLKAPTQRSERSTRLAQAQWLLTTYKRVAPNPNTATPLLVPWRPYAGVGRVRRDGGALGAAACASLGGAGGPQVVDLAA
jgi:hypothetical protein